MFDFSEIITWMMLPEVIHTIVFAVGVYLVLLWIALIIWTTKDIISRTNNVLIQIISILLVVLLNIFGILIYLAIRPSKTLIEKFFEDLEFEALMQESKKIKKKKKEEKPPKKKAKKKKSAK